MQNKLNEWFAPHSVKHSMYTIYKLHAIAHSNSCLFVRLDLFPLVLSFSLHQLHFASVLLGLRLFWVSMSFLLSICIWILDFFFMPRNFQCDSSVNDTMYAHPTASIDIWLCALAATYDQFLHKYTLHKIIMSSQHWTLKIGTILLENAHCTSVPYSVQDTSNIMYHVKTFHILMHPWSIYCKRKRFQKCLNKSRHRTHNEWERVRATPKNDLSYFGYKTDCCHVMSCEQSVKIQSVLKMNQIHIQHRITFVLLIIFSVHLKNEKKKK